MKRLSKIWNHLEEFLGTICLLLIISFVFLNVIFRYLFNFTVGWFEEVSTILFIWLVIFGISLAVREKLHPTIDMIFHLFSSKIKPFISKFIAILTMILLIFLILGGLSFALNMGPQKMMNTINLEYTFVYISLPIGFGLMLIRYIVSFISELK